MDRVILFNLLQVLVTAYALLRGGAPERIAGASLLIATLLTHMMQDDIGVRFVGIEGGVFLVDAVLLAVLLVLALYADRFWTIWIVALHMLGTAAHVVRAIDHDVIRLAYAILAAAWSYPMILILAVGTARHARRIKIEGSDPDWSVLAAD